MSKKSLKKLFEKCLTSKLRKKKFKNLTEKNPSLKLEEDIQIKNSQQLFLGDNVIIQKGCILHCGGMKWSNFKGKISIGSNSVISPYCILYGAGEISIGNNFDCAPMVGIYSSYSDHKKMNEHVFSKIKIGNNVTIFSNSVISAGVSIGDNSVIGAQSLVLKDIPSNEFWAGNPAKLIKKYK